MFRTRVVGASLAVLACVTLTALDAQAQQSASGIAGIVNDASGQPVAGVTVEASSAVLIEKTRTGVTDGRGQYKILDLVAGSYVVTFSAMGFRTVQHTGVELAQAQTVTVNASLSSGNPGETITVSATTTQVDAQNSVQNEIVTSETTEALPSGAKAIANVSNVVGGMTSSIVDVGGLAGMLNSAGNGATFHGKNGIKRVVNGSRVDDVEGNGAAGFIIDPVSIQNVVTETGGGSAESVASGFMLNNIPKAGGNTLKFEANALYTNTSFQGTNLDASLIAAGLTSGQPVVNLYDYSASLGGPIVKDRLWFFASDRLWGVTGQRPGIFLAVPSSVAVAPAGNLYVPSTTPADRYDLARSEVGHFTWQASATNKIAFYMDYQNNCHCFGTAPLGSLAYEADTPRRFHPNALYQVNWTSTVTKKLLFEVSVAWVPSQWPMGYEAGTSLTAIPITELENAFNYNAPAMVNPKQVSNRQSQRATAAYVTGSHAFKVGFSLEEGTHQILETVPPNNVAYGFLNQKPNNITEWATPFEHDENMNADLGIFAQDQWTIKRLTLNYGLRFDYFNASVPAQNEAATYFVAARSYAAVNCVPCWKDLSPRVGAAYDLFGNGKTSLKVAVGKFMNLQATTLASANNPLNTSVNSVTRTWNDTNGNLIPDCNLTNPAANGECGPISNAAFGSPHIVTTYSPNAINGWGARDYIWDISTEVQHQVSPQLMVKGGYYRNWAGNILGTDNVAVSPSDYSPYCISAPTDSRLPGSGGYPICGLYDVAPAKFSAVQNVVQQASTFGTATNVNDYYNFTFAWRSSGGVRVGGSVDTGRNVSNDCLVINNPEQAMYNNGGSGVAGAAGTGSATNVLPCLSVSPWMANLQLKLNGTYPLPAGLTVSGTFQNLAGPQILANYLAPNSLIAPSLGRNLAACGSASVCTATASVPLITPGTQYEPRRNQIDLRLAKTFALGSKARFTGKLDVYNILNSSAVLTVNTTYGSQWQKPTGILDARLAELSGTFAF